MRQTPPAISEAEKSDRLKLINDYGVSLAETGRQLGISTSGVAQILGGVRKFEFVGFVNNVSWQKDPGASPGSSCVSLLRAERSDDHAAHPETRRRKMKV